VSAVAAQPSSRIDQLYAWFSSFRVAVTTISGFLVLVITVLGTVDVAGRFFFDQPLQGQVEISRVLTAYLVFVGLAEAHRTGNQVRLEFIDKYVSPAAMSLTTIVLTILAIATVAVVLYATSVMFWVSWTTGETMMAAIVLPTWLAKAAIALGFLLYIIELMFDVARRVSAWTHS
jgi:TRAP-type mannitol/chloroaromatic compound transport system permease small subunit